MQQRARQPPIQPLGAGVGYFDEVSILDRIHMLDDVTRTMKISKLNILIVRKRQPVLGGGIHLAHEGRVNNRRTGTVVGVGTRRDPLDDRFINAFALSGIIDDQPDISSRGGFIEGEKGHQAKNDHEESAKPISPDL